MIGAGIMSVKAF